MTFDDPFICLSKGVCRLSASPRRWEITPRTSRLGDLTVFNYNFCTIDFTFSQAKMMADS